MGHHSGYSSTLLSPFSQNAAIAMRDSREREKKEISDLNDRLAGYIEKVRFLEAQNRKIQTDIQMLSGRYGKDAQNIKQIYESELIEAQKLIKETNKAREEGLIQLNVMIKEVHASKKNLFDGTRSRALDKDRIAELSHKLSAIESEIQFYQRRINGVNEEIKRIKQENSGLITELQRSRTELDQETLNRIDQQNKVQTLLEEVEYLRRINDQELKDLQTLAVRDTTSENREYFKNELSDAIHEIRQEYDQINHLNRNEVDSWYRLRIQEIQTNSARQTMEKSYTHEEFKRLRLQLTDLRSKLADFESKNNLLQHKIQQLNIQIGDDHRNYEISLNERDDKIHKVRGECQNLMVELQMLLDTKQIALYRKMLEGDKNRSGLKQLIEQAMSNQIAIGPQQSSSSKLIIPAGYRLTYQRSAKGNVTIQEVSPDGHFIILQNTHRSKEEKIGEWKLRRKILNQPEIVFTFPKKFVLKPGKAVKVCAKYRGSNFPPDQLVDNNLLSFGVGTNAQTSLLNKDGDERATFLQKLATD